MKMDTQGGGGNEDGYTGRGGNEDGYAGRGSK